MSNLVYLLLAVTISLVGSLVVWFRHRPPRSFEFGIDEFQKELEALAPEQNSPPSILRSTSSPEDQAR